MLSSLKMSDVGLTMGSGPSNELLKLKGSLMSDQTLMPRWAARSAGRLQGGVSCLFVLLQFNPKL